MFQKILIAIDIPSEDNQAFLKGLELAKTINAQLMLLHVLFPGEGGAPFPPENMSFVPFESIGTLNDAVIERYRENWGNYEKEIQEQLTALGKIAQQQGVETEWSLNQGVPSRLICEVASSWDADLVVISRGHQSAIGKFFMGSVSDYVMHHAPCAVLIDQSS